MRLKSRMRNQIFAKERRQESDRRTYKRIKDVRENQGEVAMESHNTNVSAMRG